MSFLSLLLVAMNIEAVVSQTTTIFNVLAADPELGGLASLTTLLGLGDFLNSTSTSSSVFAPINSAFAAVDPKFLTPDWLLHLTNLVSNHVVAPAVILSTDFTDGLIITSTVGENFTASVAPPTISLSGDNFGTSTIIEADLTASNGVVHKVDTVLLSDAVTLNLAEVLGAVLGNNGNPFSIFLALLETTDLADSFRADDITALVPVDAVFEALDPSVVAALTDPSNSGLLSDVLSNHIIPGPAIYTSTQLSTTTTLTTLFGEEITVSFLDGTPAMAEFTTPSGIVATGFALDGLGFNGVVHAVDAILLPDISIDASVAPSTETAAPIVTTEPPVTTPVPIPVITPPPSVAPFTTPPPPISIPPVLLLPTDVVIQKFVKKCTKNVVVPSPVPPPSGKGKGGMSGMSGMSGMMSGRRDLHVDVDGGRYLLSEFCIAIDEYCAALDDSSTGKGKGKGGGGMSGMMMGGSRRELTEAFTPDLCDTLDVSPPTGKGKGGMMMGMSGMMMSSRF